MEVALAKRSVATDCVSYNFINYFLAKNSKSNSMFHGHVSDICIIMPDQNTHKVNNLYSIIILLSALFGAARLFSPVWSNNPPLIAAGSATTRPAARRPQIA